MASATFPNVYTHRKVADTSSKGCNVCYKPTTSVLITPEKQDFFYVCAIHLKDRNFATPIIDHAAIEARIKAEAEAEAKKKKELEEEVERVKKEYAEKQKAKAEKGGKDKANEETKDEEKDKDKAQPTSTSEETPKPEDKANNATTTTVTAGSAADDEPRVFALARSFYNQRLDKKRQIEMAKRTRERMQNPSFFPSVPKGLP